MGIAFVFYKIILINLKYELCKRKKQQQRKKQEQRKQQNQRTKQNQRNTETQQRNTSKVLCIEKKKALLKPVPERQ